jgi:hypothetical protein
MNMYIGYIFDLKPMRTLTFTRTVGTVLVHVVTGKIQFAIYCNVS